MTEGYQQEAQHALSSGNVAKCIELLKAKVEDQDLRQQILQAEIRYNGLRRRINAGTISHDDAYLEENKISNSLLFIISNLARHSPRSLTSRGAASSSSPSFGKKSTGFGWKWLVLGILGGGALALLAFLALRPDPQASHPCAQVRCANGGNCIDGTCYCPDGFSGPRCEQRVAEPSAEVESGEGSSGNAAPGNSAAPAANERDPQAVDPSPANLRISNFKMTPYPPVIKQGVEVSFMIENTGEATAQNFTVAYWAGENFPEPAFTESYRSLAGGKSQAVRFRYAGYASWYGKLRNKIEVDTKNRVRESNEQDNVYQATFAVLRTSSPGSSDASSTTQSALPDLKITAFQMKPDPPVKKQRVYMQAVIRNVGKGDAGKFGFQYFPGENYPKPAYEQSFSGLRAGGQQVISFQYDGYPSHYGSIRNKLVVDPGNRVKESNESNNTYQERLTVRVD